jgi:transposase
MDRGMVSQENVSWLQGTGRRYVLGASRTELKRWRADLTSEADWNRVREGVEVKLCAGPDGNEAFVLCRSAERTEKEKAMHERFVHRIEEGLQSLARRLRSAKQRLERSRLDRQIGRLLGRNSRAAGRFDVTLEDDPGEPSGLRLVWTSRSEWDEWARISEGCYVLRTNILDWKPEDLWSTYIQLTQAEAAFRIQKSDLAIRPIWHQKAGRVKGHILVCFLAYVLWKTLEKWQEKAGLGNSPKTILEQLASIQSADVVLPTAESPSRDLRIRCVVRPDNVQSMLLDRLGLRLPERLRSAPLVPGM